MMQAVCQSRFEQLMEIADRYARHLSGNPEKAMPPGVVMLERDGKLHTVLCDGSPRELAATTRDLVVRHHVTSVALIVRVEAATPASGPTVGDSVYVFGETAEGASEERRYRVQAGSRRHRFAPLPPADDGAPDITQTFRSLFGKYAVNRAAQWAR